MINDKLQYIQILMRFGKNLSHLAIPQWKQCYLDYEHLKIFIRIIKLIVQTIQVCEKKIDAIKSIKRNDIVDQSIELQIEGQDKLANLMDSVVALRKIGQKVNELFFDAHFKGMIINRLFLHMKLLQMKQCFQKCKKIRQLNLSFYQNGLLMQIMQFIYVQTSLLQNAKELNLEAERKIFKKHAKYSLKYFQTPRGRSKKMVRMSKSFDKLVGDMENFYVQNTPGSSKKNRDKLRQLAKKQQSSYADSFIFGSWIGICITILGVLIAMLVYTGKSVETDYVFNRDFPTWRGIAFFIIYTWILGFNIYGFQKFSISHRIIFEFNEHHYSTSTEIFKVSGFFSTFFLIMFAVYTLAITKITQLRVVQPEYLVLFVWGLFILYLINPLPILSFRSRLYSVKLAIKSILAPLVGVSFPVIWMTDQLISLITPFKDFAYTICYYLHLFKAQNADISHNSCSQAGRIEVVFVVGAVAYSYRILQCLKQGYDKRKFFFQPQFFNTLKYSFSFITLTLSFLWKAGNNTLFYAWIVFASLSTVYSYIWDIKIDWALFQKESPHKFLRKNLCYPINSYYVIIILNFLFRIVWAATLSPSIANTAFGSPQIFSLVTGTIEILRRGIWNMLRVEREHISNCKNFKATLTTIQTIQALLFQSLGKKKQSNQHPTQSQSLQNVMENPREKINEIGLEINMIKGQHLSMLNQILQVEFNEKITRINKLDRLSKQVKSIKQLVKQEGIKNKKQESD